MNISDYKAEFDKTADHPHFSENLNTTREKAFAKFLDLGLPTKKWESWKHTNLSRLKLSLIHI